MTVRRLVHDERGISLILVSSFIDQRVGNQVYGYVMPILGVMASGAGPAPSGSFPAAIRLVQ